MALSQHPARLILIFTKKRKGPHGREFVTHLAIVNQVRREQITIYCGLVLVKRDSIIARDRMYFSNCCENVHRDAKIKYHLFVII